jgi:hypothetical protein
MPFQTPSLGGAPVFGYAAMIHPLPNPPALQLDAYAGLNGQVSQFGGTRGGRIRITGHFVEEDIPTVNNDLATLVSYNDGIARTIVDCEGIPYFNCVFAGLSSPRAAIAVPGFGDSGGWLKEYSVEFVVLSG